MDLQEQVDPLVFLGPLVLAEHPGLQEHPVHREQMGLLEPLDRVALREFLVPAGLRVLLGLAD